MLLVILMLIFGIIALAKGEFKITGGRKVKGSTGRILGILLLIGAGAVIVPDYGGGLQLLLLIAVIVVGLATSEEIVLAPTPAGGTVQPSTTPLSGAEVLEGRKAQIAADLCPKCGARVDSTDQNCPACRINLAFAREHLDQW